MNRFEEEHSGRSNIYTRGTRLFGTREIFGRGWREERERELAASETRGNTDRHAWEPLNNIRVHLVASKGVKGSSCTAISG